MLCWFRMLAYESVQPDNEGDEAMPNKVKFVSEDMSTFFDKCVPAYAAPGEVTEGDRPLDREYWDREVRE